jgi:hypothetical protein
MTQTEREQVIRLLYQFMVIYYDQDYTITNLKTDLKFMRSSMNSKVSEQKQIINELLQDNG